jgi:hypothetical protein
MLLQHLLCTCTCCVCTGGSIDTHAMVCLQECVTIPVLRNVNECQLVQKERDECTDYTTRTCTKVRSAAGPCWPLWSAVALNRLGCDTGPDQWMLALHTSGQQTPVLARLSVCIQAACCKSRTSTTGDLPVDCACCRCSPDCMALTGQGDVFQPATLACGCILLQTCKPECREITRQVAAPLSTGKGG